jgi:hypothetical protein
MLGEIETAFHVMNHRDHIPRHRRSGGDRFVPVLKSNNLRDDIFELIHMILTYFAGIKEVAVFLRQSASEFWCGHEVDCVMSELFA